MLLGSGVDEKIIEEDEDKSDNGKRDDENKEDLIQKPVFNRRELKDKLWKVVGEGHSSDLTDTLRKAKNFNNLELLLNEENEEFDEDGNNLLLYCIKEGCDSGPAFGRHFHKCADILIKHNVNVNHHNKSGHTPLFEAVFHRNTSYITVLLQNKAETDRFDQDGIDPLHLAIHLGYKDCFNLIAHHENKEIYDRKDERGVPPLVAAVQHGHIDLCHLILDGGCDINATDRKLKRTALHYAISTKRFDIFELLLKYKPKLDVPDHRGKTVLHRVSAIQELRYLKKLLHGGFPKSLMDQESDDGLTPVIIACQSGNAEQLKELLENGASVTTTDKTGKTALHYCADNLETQCAEMLLMRDESLIHVQDEQGFTPLHMSVIGGNVPMLKLLVRKGADINILDSDGHTPSHWATVCTHLEILDVLIEHDAEISQCDNHNAYPIHYAAQMNGRDNGHSDTKIGEKVLKKLLDSGIPCDVMDKDRRQPLLWAASAGNSESCKLLVSAGAEINSIDKDGLTALHCAASRGHSECVDRLKKLGADVNIADVNGCTALFYAITLGNKDCTRFLLKYGADPNHKDSRGRTPTHCAAIKGCLETVKMLEKSKADLWFPSFRGDCPIHEASQGGHCDVVKYLLKAKNTPEAVNIANDAGRTCLHIAAIVNNLPLCKLLLDNNADKNALMKNKDKSYTPYDAAIIKGNNEIADYIKSKGGVSGGDIDNILQAKGKKRDAKSAKSRKSVQTLESTPEEAEPENNKNTEDNKKAEENTEVVPVVEDDKKKKDKGKKKEKEEKEREKEKLVIVPKDKQKKSDQEEKGKADQKESEKEKSDVSKEGKGEKTDLTEEELKELQAKIKAGEGEADERDIKRKPIKEIEPAITEEEKQRKDSVEEKDQEDQEKNKDLSEEEQKALQAKILADERERKQKEEKESAQKKKGKDKKGETSAGKGKKKELTDDELKALQDQIKAGQGDADKRDKKQKSKTKEEEKREKSGKGKPDLTDAELAAIAAAVVVAEQEERDKGTPKQQTKDKTTPKQQQKDKTTPKQQQKDKATPKQQEKDKGTPKSRERKEKDQDLKTKDKKAELESLVIPPPSSPDLRDSQKDQKLKDKKDQDQKSKDKKDQDQKSKDRKEEFEGLVIPPPSSPDLRDSQKDQKLKDKKDQDQKSKDKKDQDQKSKDKKDQDQKSKDKKEEFEGLVIPPSSPDLRDPHKKSKERDKGDIGSYGREISEIPLGKEDFKKRDDLDSEERGSGKEDSKEKEVIHFAIPSKAFQESPVASASERSRRDSPVKYRSPTRSRSKSSDNEEFEFPEGAHETAEAAIAAAEARRKERERSRSRSTDRESVERQKDLRRYSKVGNDGRIQPGLLAEKDGRNRRFDERDSPSLEDSEDEFIDDPYFGRRIKPYGGNLRLGSKWQDNRQKLLREKSELKRKKQLEKMSRSSQKQSTRGGAGRMMPLGYSKLDTLQRPITRKSNSVQESVRRYQTERTFVRQLHQLKRAQIYTGPMHDIVLFSKLMDVYKNSSTYDSELDIESQGLDDWDGYLQDQLRFVSHYYEDDRTGLRDTAKEYHQQLEQSATDAKRTVDSRIDHIIKRNEKDQAVEREQTEKLDKKINTMAEKTESILDSVRQQANHSVASARDVNTTLEDDMRKDRQERLKNSKYSNQREKSWLLEQEAMDHRQSRMDEHEKDRKEKHKEWLRKKDEEMRKKLMKVYGPTPVFEKPISKKGTPLKASTPKPLMNSSRSSSRPKSMMSSISGTRSRPQDQELEVHMTEFGMRRVKVDNYSFAKMSTPQSQSCIRPAAALPANWTPKYDMVNLRPRAGLVFVEPAVYDQVLEEEKMIRTGQTRNSTRNFTLENDSKMLETVDS